MLEAVPHLGDAGSIPVWETGFFFFYFKGFFPNFGEFNRILRIFKGSYKPIFLKFSPIFQNFKILPKKSTKLAYNARAPYPAYNAIPHIALFW